MRQRPQRAEVMQRISLDLPVRQQNRLAALARARGCSRSALIREAIARFIRHHAVSAKEARMKLAGRWRESDGLPQMSLRHEERF